MATSTMRNQISRFLASETPEVMSIKGAWGVGKTYAWNTFLKAAKSQNKIALERYSYVSLFGLNSLADLKFAIFENMVEQKLIGQTPTVDSFKSNTVDLLKSLGKRPLPLLSSASTLDHYRSMIDSISFLSLEKAIICIDDFERKGQGIAAQDVLGLMTQLKEQKKCKVVLILNDTNLGEDGCSDYDRFKEKVIDTEVRFAPTTEDCVSIALSNDKTGTLLSESLTQLRINNIRIIKKIENLSTLLLPPLRKYDDQVLIRALHALVLLTWCYYDQSGAAPDYGFVINRTSTFSDPEEDLTLSTQRQGWCAILRRYDDFVMTDFDVQIAGLVENGYYNESCLMKEAQLFDEKIKATRSEDSFQQAWHKFHDSFDDDTQDVVDCLAQSFKNDAKYISLANLDGSVRLLRHLGREKLASGIIDLYLEKHRDKLLPLAFAAAVSDGQIKDAEVIEKFKRQLDALKVRKSLKELCDLLLEDENGRDEEEQLMARIPVQDYIRLFKTERGAQLSRYIDLCLKYGRLGGINDTRKQICDNAVEALKEIGGESRLNASRVRRFGIIVD